MAELGALRPARVREALTRPLARRLRAHVARESWTLLGLLQHTPPGSETILLLDSPTLRLHASPLRSLLHPRTIRIEVDGPGWALPPGTYLVVRGGADHGAWTARSERVCVHDGLELWRGLESP